MVCESAAYTGGLRTPAFDSNTAVHNLKSGTLNMLHCSKKMVIDALLKPKGTSQLTSLHQFVFFTTIPILPLPGK